MRIAIKGLNKDKTIIQETDFELKSNYLKLIEDALIKANDELRQLHKYPLEIKKTDQPTVYEVKIGNRIGFMEINVVEIASEISKLF